jgi:hypothetical protein
MTRLTTITFLAPDHDGARRTAAGARAMPVRLHAIGQLLHRHAQALTHRAYRAVSRWLAAKSTQRWTGEDLIGTQPHRVVALAGQCFEPRAIENVDEPAPVADEPLALQEARRGRGKLAERIEVDAWPYS